MRKGFTNNFKAIHKFCKLNINDVYWVWMGGGGCRIMLICEELWHYYTLPAVARVSTQHLLNATEPSNPPAPHRRGRNRERETV